MNWLFDDLHKGEQVKHSYNFVWVACIPNLGDSHCEIVNLWIEIMKMEN